MQNENYQVRVEGLQVINGSQTCKTIQRALAARKADDFEKSFVLIRLYELPSDQAALVRNITYATNSQNPVDLRDLKSNDQRQMSLEMALKELGYEYRRQRSTAPIGAKTITNEVAAKAVLSIWRRRPHQAKFQEREHFGKLYDLIFSPDLNGAQIVVANTIMEDIDVVSPEFIGLWPFAPYSHCFAGMLIGQYLLNDLGVTLKQLDHIHLSRALSLYDANVGDYWSRAMNDIQAALTRLYGEQDVSLQRLSATFRRGDLIAELAKLTSSTPTSDPRPTTAPSL